MFNRRETTTLILMGFVHFCLIVDFMIIMPMGPQLMRIHEMAAQQFSYLVSVFTLSAGLAGILAAFFVDRFDRKRAMLFVLSGFFIGNLATAWAQSFETLMLARALTGAFVGVIGSLMLAIVSDAVSLERRATAIGLVMSAFAFASIMGVPLCLYLSNQMGWSAPFIFIAVLSAFLISAIYFYLPAMDSHLSSSSQVQGRQKFLYLVTEKNRKKALLFITFLILGHFSINPFLFPSIVANAGITESKLPVVYFFAGLGSIVASILFGRWADNSGRRRVFTWALVASLVPIFLVTHFFPSSLLFVTLFVTAFFTLMGGRTTPAMTIVTSTTDPDLRSSFLSLVSSIQHLAAAVASILSGAIVVKNDQGQLLNFSKVGLLAIGFSLVALYFGRQIQANEPDLKSGP